MAFLAQLVSIPHGYFNVGSLQVRGDVHCPVGRSTNNALVVTLAMLQLGYVDTTENVPPTFAWAVSRVGG